MYRVARRSLAIFASAVACVADTNALRTTMASGGVVPGDSLSASVGPSGSPALAADVVGSGAVPGATTAAAAAAAVRTAERGDDLSTAAASSAAAAKNVVNR